jgi:hypothetical protein
LARKIKRKLRAHLVVLHGYDGARGNGVADKAGIRSRHESHRQECLNDAKQFLAEQYNGLEKHFASGKEVQPERISPRLQLISSDTEESCLFRLASLTWSIPVSEGYGRRMRFLVWDENNDKLIGLIAVGDPVFNLRVRDNLVGWNAEGRKRGLVNVMDAYVLGAVPPYNMILGGKLVACLVRTTEVRDEFRHRYANNAGIISGEDKRPKLVMVTTSSALGRSSVYNRLKLHGTDYFKSIGYTSGFGHFHVSNGLFGDMRELLLLQRHPYWNGNRFGNGPNWKFRTIRAALEGMGVDRDLLRHGIKREVFVSLLARNGYEILRGERKRPDYAGLFSVKEVGELAVGRWLCPRASRRPEFLSWDRSNLKCLVQCTA